MIQNAMTAVAQDLNAMLCGRRGDSRDRVILCHPREQPGGGEDRICLVLTQIAEDKNVANAAPRARLSPPVSLHLQVLFVAQYAHYETGLAMISEVIAHLHSKPVFTQANTPAMDAGLDRLALEMLTPTYAEQSCLWAMLGAMLGANYSPSVLYSMRMLTFGGGQTEAIEPVVERPLAGGHPLDGGFLSQ